MKYIGEQFKIKFSPVANQGAVITGEFVRFTVLTSRLIRMEYSPINKFEDRASEAFWYREQPLPDFKVIQDNEKIEIITEHLHLSYNISSLGFTRNTLSIKLKESGKVWRYGDIDEQNLKGTARTLDEADGEIKLENGLISRSGWSVADDSGKVVFDENSWITNRFDISDTEVRLKTKDIYFFGYGTDYKSCLKDFSKISGKTPIFPRWVLGNWWSRFYDYTQEELTGLMMEFEENDIPLSVCIVDMDWHVIKNDYHPGWTGYTWNKDLFPDHKAFINWLHEKDIKTALNLHPALGVHPHEEKYSEMAEFMGIDPDTENPVEFDIIDPMYTKGYFEILHNPLEAEGVDFWWLDWQQGTETKLQGLDPLSWLNHLHFLDLGKDGVKRPFIFSRYGGLGNHRYPIGFSGDTIVTWDSLAFQPYFTSTASNVGYSWWSHDIGGHMGGIEDPELYTRWVQYGVFSPILRLHSTKTNFSERRPWAFEENTFKYTKAAMQLRHSLIPYLYTMLWRNHTEDIPAILPMYYEHPQEDNAYHCKNQYYFGSELVVSPFVHPNDPEIKLSRQTLWLPEGDWFNFFTGEYYPGNATYAVYGDISEIPVFAKAGAIVPLAPKVKRNGTGIPEELEIYLFPGKSSSFELYEDDGETVYYKNGNYSLTNMEQKWTENKLSFEIKAPRGNTNHLPALRSYKIIIKGIKNSEIIEAKINGEATEYIKEYDALQETLILSTFRLKQSDALVLILANESDSLMSKEDRTWIRFRKLLKNMSLEGFTKRDIDEKKEEIRANPQILYKYSDKLSASQTRAIIETIKGGELISLL